jgi:hypothetical protein
LGGEGGVGRGKREAEEQEAKKRKRSHDVWIDPCVFICMMIQEEMSIIREVIVSVSVRKKSSYEHVPKSEWLQRESCMNLQTQLQFSFLCGVE